MSRLRLRTGPGFARLPVSFSEQENGPLPPLPFRTDFSAFPADFATLRRGWAALDGEFVCLDDRGRPDFLALLYRRGSPSFVASDVLALDGRDLRDEPLRTRKRRLARIVPSPATSVLALQPIAESGVKLYEAVCSADLEGIVAKNRDAPYRLVEPAPWRKIRNPTYSQAVGRWKLFGPC